MRQEVKIYSEEKYLPTKRCKKLRTRRVKNMVEVDIKEIINDKDFPVAFIVHDYKSVYEGAMSYSDFDGNGEYKQFSEEIRTYNGKLFMPVRVTHGSAISTCFESVDYIKYRIQDSHPYYIDGDEFSDKSIIVDSDLEERKSKLQEHVKRYVILDGKVWEKCGEPMYNINTFGLGHNHGGTGFFITFMYNSNISHKNYFNALRREEAIAYGKQMALNRGDTNSVDSIGAYNNIEVIMPEMVTRNPEREHGNGDKFIDSIEEMICSTDSSEEAGILAMAMCAVAINNE